MSQKIQDTMVALRQRGDDRAATIAAKLLRAAKRQQTLSFGIKDMAERAVRPTIAAEKRAGYERSLAECRAELPLVEAQLAFYQREAELLLADAN